MIHPAVMALGLVAWLLAAAVAFHKGMTGWGATCLIGAMVTGVIFLLVEVNSP